MEANLSFHFHYTFEDTTLKDFISVYLLKKKNDQGLLKETQKDNNRVEFLISKKIPYYLRLFLHISKVEYLESLHILEDKAEVNVWQSLGDITSRVNMNITENKLTNETVLVVIFNVNNTQSMFQSTIKSYIKNEFDKEMKEISKMISSNSS